MTTGKDGQPREAALAVIQQMIQDGKYSPALRKLRSMLDTHPDDTAARYLMGVASFQSGRAEEALAGVEQVQAARPDIPELRTNMGAAMAAVGRLEDAAQILQKVLNGNPRDIRARDNLVQVYMETGELKQALEVCGARITAFPDDPEGYFLRGNVNLMLGDAESAIQDYQRALDLNPDDPRLHYNLGFAWYSTGHQKEAVAAFQRFSRTDRKVAALHVYGNSQILFRRALALAKQNRRLRSDERRGGIIGISPQMEDLFEMLDRVAPRDITVFIQGETGVGKELFAREIHNSSPRKNGPFVAFNASALPSDLIESELFGYRKGAFTGALQDKYGLFETASGGTLFLDEIGDLSMLAQAKILRALQERKIRRVGDTKEIPIDVRLVTATNKNLLQMVQEGTFRSDLYYRLKVMELYIPPLRERPIDIPVLAEHFLDKYARRHGLSIHAIEPEAMSRLEAHLWPGNVRELENAINSAVVLAGDANESIRDIDLPPEIVPENRPKPCSGRKSVEDPKKERARVLQALEDTRWHRGRAAEQLGISRRHIYRLMEKYGIRA